MIILLILLILAVPVLLFVLGSGRVSAESDATAERQFAERNNGIESF